MAFQAFWVDVKNRKYQRCTTPLSERKQRGWASWSASSFGWVRRKIVPTIWSYRIIMMKNRTLMPTELEKQIAAHVDAKLCSIWSLPCSPSTAKAPLYAVHRQQTQYLGTVICWNIFASTHFQLEIHFFCGLENLPCFLRIRGNCKRPLFHQQALLKRFKYILFCGKIIRKSQSLQF